MVEASSTWHTLTDETEAFNESVNWMAVELLQTNKPSFTKESDIWSLGMTIYVYDNSFLCAILTS